MLVVLLYYGTVAAIVIVGAVAAVRMHLRDLPGIRATGNAMTAATCRSRGPAVAVAFARVTGYDDSAPPVLFADVALVVAALASATVLARRWALRDQTPKTTTRPA
jgi:hypothetical protein